MNMDVDGNAPGINLLSNEDEKGALTKARKQLAGWFVRRKSNLALAFGLGLIVAGSLYVYLHLNLSGDSLVTKVAKRLTSSPNQLVDGDFVKLTIPDREPPFFTLATTERSRFGILPSTSFTLTAQEPLTEELVEDLLTASVPVTVRQTADDTYEITPITTLGKDESIVIRMATKDVTRGDESFDRDYSWAFQTQGDFRVVSNIPGNERTKVPTNTGIEIVFSQDDYKDPKSLITITPNIEYRLERHDETLAIVPLNPLDPQTSYTVTLSRGLDLTSRSDPIEEDYSFSFQTESLTEKERKPYLSLTDTFIQVTPRDQAQAKVYAYNADSISIKTTVYAISSTDEFISSRSGHDKYMYSWRRYYAEAEPVDTSNFERVFDADLSISNQNNIRFLQLPQALPEGNYLVEFAYGENQVEYLWLQSSFVSAYTSIGRKESLVWVNSLDSATKIELANVSIHGSGDSYPVGADGVGVFATPNSLFDEQVDYLLVRNNDGRELVLPISKLNHYTGPGKKTPNDYWSYLYQERRIYQQNDTVYFWGIVKDRDTDAPPGNITLKLESETQTISPQSDGSFIGSFKLNNVAEGWYSVEAMVNDVEIVSSRFQVISYTKPEMKIELVTDKNAIFADESVTYEIISQYFDGTPASNMELKVNTSHNDADTTVTTDDNGRATFTYESIFTPDNANYRKYPRYETVTVTPQRSQDSTVEGFGSVYVYGPRIGIDSDNSQENDTASIRGEVYQVDLNGLNTGTSQEIKGSTVPNHKLHLTVEKSWWERKESGTYYDYVEKVTRPQYTYTEHKETVVDTDLTTDGEGIYNFDLKMEEKKSYRATITTNDNDGRTVWSTAYFYYYPNSTRLNNYGGISDSTYLKLKGDKNTFSVGEQVSLEVSYRDELYPTSEQTKFLFTTASRGTQSYVISSDPTYDFDFPERHVPNVSIGAMIFNGSAYENVTTQCEWQWHCYYGYYYEQGYPFSGITVEYDDADSELDVEIIPAQTSYNPGEDASIDVRVTKDGKGVVDASVQLVLVDQALEAIGGVRKPSVLSSLYTHVSHDIYYRYFTHRPLFPDVPQAEKGGGGGDRDLFKDTPFFGAAVTDGDGRARFSFTLSDDITTFIMYAQSVTNDLDAGQQTGYLPVTQDFFVTSNFPREILTSDEAMLAGSGVGRALTQGDQVNYEMLVKSTDDVELQKLVDTGKAFEEISFAIPQLEIGAYKTILRGTYGSYSDGLSYPLNVLLSRMDLQSSESYELSSGESVSQLINPVDRSLPVSLTVTDAGKSQFFFDLLRIGSCNSNRLEKRIARARAKTILKDVFEVDICGGGNALTVDFQTNTGGLSQVKWGGDNLKTTVWATFVSPDVFDKGKLKAYFDSQLTKERSGTIQQTYAAWGLAMLDEPELLTLYKLRETAVTFEEKVIIALALADSGDVDVARDMYLDILADLAYTKNPYIRIQDNSSDGDADAYILNTSYALLLSSMVDDTYSKGMHAYITDYEHLADEIVTDLAEIAFIESELIKAPPEDTEISFTLHGSTTNQTIDYGRSFRRILRNTDVDNFSITANSGKAEAIFCYTVPVTEISNYLSDDRLSLTRSFEKAEGGESIKPGDIVRITLRFDVDREIGPRGLYKVTDHLPSGLVLIKQPRLYGLSPVGYVQQLRNNVIESNFYHSDWWHKQGIKQVIYYARAVAPGAYLYEPAILQSGRDLSVMKFTEGDKLTVNSLD